MNSACIILFIIMELVTLVVLFILGWNIGKCKSLKMQILLGLVAVAMTMMFTELLKCLEILLIK